MLTRAVNYLRRESLSPPAAASDLALASARKPGAFGADRPPNAQRHQARNMIAGGVVYESWALKSPARLCCADRGEVHRAGNDLGQDRDSGFRSGPDINRYRGALTSLNISKV